MVSSMMLPAVSAASTECPSATSVPMGTTSGNRRSNWPGTGRAVVRFRLLLDEPYFVPLVHEPS